MSLENFNAVLDKLQAYDASDVLEPFMPVYIALGAANDLKSWALPDLEQLQKAGLTIELYESLEIGAGALQHAQSEWVSEKNTRSDSIKEWRKISPRGYELQSYFEHAFRFAFYGHDDLLSRVDEIAKNSGNADMVQDLSDYTTLGNDNLVLFETTDFDIQLLEESKLLATSLGALLADNNRDNNKSSDTKAMRDRAFTYLISVVREVRRIGQYVFWRTPERKKGYVNNYK